MGAPEPRGLQTSEPAAAQPLVPASDQMLHHAVIASIREVSHSAALNGAPGVEIELTSDTMFPVRDALPTLHIGSESFQLSGHRNGDLHTIFFVLDASEFAALPNGTQVVISYGDPGGESWDAGTLNKSMLQKE